MLKKPCLFFARINFHFTIAIYQFICYNINTFGNIANTIIFME